VDSVARLATAFWISILFAIALPASIRAAQGDEALDPFHRAIDSYMALRRAAELGVTSLEVTPMRDEIQQAKDQLLSASCVLRCTRYFTRTKQTSLRRGLTSQSARARTIAGPASGRRRRMDCLQYRSRRDALSSSR
jgi:hypothetical protein